MELMKKIVKKLEAFIKFAFSSGICFVIDLLTFKGLVVLLEAGSIEKQKAIVIGTIGARVLSSVVNYSINRKVVFKGNNKRRSFVRYYSLCVLQLCTSAALVAAVWNVVRIDEAIVKFFVDVVLFLISFQLQKRWVFK